jgi:hypothetical protein
MIVVGFQVIFMALISILHFIHTCTQSRHNTLSSTRNERGGMKLGGVFINVAHRRTFRCCMSSLIEEESLVVVAHWLVLRTLTLSTVSE